MSIRNKLHVTEFRKVPFSIRSRSVNGGRFEVVHEFPLSGKRFVEDVGLNLESISYEAFVSGDDVLEKRKALLVALNKGGEGILVDLFDGPITVNSGAFTYTDSITRMGETRFTLNFKVSQPPSLTTTTESSAESVVEKNTKTKKDAEKNIAEHFGAAPENDNTQTYIEKIREVSTFSRANANNFPFLDTATEAVNTLNKLLTELEENAPSLVSKPAQLGLDVTDVIRQVIAEGRSSINALRTALDFFAFGDDDILKTPNTIARKEIAKNFGLINGSIKAMAVSEAYKGIVLSDFDTVDDIRAVLGRTEKEFFRLEESIIISLPSEVVGDNIERILGAAIEANDSSFFSIITDDLLAQVKSVRDEANLIIKDKIPNLASVLVEDLATGVEPISVLTFRFYGDLENRDKILSLNQTQNPIYLTGDVNIIS